MERLVMRCLITECMNCHQAEQKLRPTVILNASKAGNTGIKLYIYIYRYKVICIRVNIAAMEKQ